MRTRRYRAFTLVEMLVAVSVLSLMFLSLAQIMSTVNQVWLHDRSRIDNFTKSRAILELIAGDLQRAVFRPDCPAFGVGTTYYLSNGNAATGQTSYTNAFYTRFGSGKSARDLALVTYSIAYATEKTTDAVYLQRSSLAIPWDAGTSSLTFQGDFTSLLTQTTPQEAAPGVVCLRFVFREKDGTLLGPGTGKSYSGYNPDNPVVAVGVALAVVSNKLSARMPLSKLKTIHDLLENASLSSGGSIKVAWDDALHANVYGKSGYPADIGVELQTFERWILCQPF